MLPWQSGKLWCPSVHESHLSPSTSHLQWHFPVSTSQVKLSEPSGLQLQSDNKSHQFLKSVILWKTYLPHCHQLSKMSCSHFYSSWQTPVITYLWKIGNFLKDIGYLNIVIWQFFWFFDMNENVLVSRIDVIFILWSRMRRGYQKEKSKDDPHDSVLNRRQTKKAWMEILQRKWPSPYIRWVNSFYKMFANKYLKSFGPQKPN